MSYGLQIGSMLDRERIPLQYWVSQKRPYACSKITEKLVKEAEK